MAEEETKFAERLDELTEVTFTQPDKVKKIGAGDYLIDITVPVPVMKHSGEIKMGEEKDDR